MGKKRKLRLSQCMIVKNEEKDIERALSWGKGIVSEQIVVDTGSTDRTVEIAEKMGAKVYHFPWIDDFSAAKNYAIEQATGDWIAFLDADEYFPPEDAKKLLLLLEAADQASHYAVSTSLFNVREDGTIMTGGSQVRLFRRLPGLHYKNRIHEELFMEGEEVLRMGDATKEFTILHTGYDDHLKKNQGKGERNVKLLLMELEEFPDDYNRMGYIGDSYSTMKKREEALKWYYKAIGLMPKTPRDRDDRSSETLRKTMTILMDREESELLKIYEIGVSMLPKESDFDYIMGEFYSMRNDYGKSVHYLERALKRIEAYGNVGMSDLTSGHLNLLWFRIAYGYYKLGNLNKCLSYCTPLLKADPYSLSATVLFLGAFVQGEKLGEVTVEQVLGLLDKMYDRTQPKNRIFLLMAARRTVYPELEKRLESRMSPEEIEMAKNTENKGEEK